MKFRRGSSRPTYSEVEAPGQDGAAVIDPKQSFVMSDRRESEQKEGFIVPDQRERFLVSESWPELHIPGGFATKQDLDVRETIFHSAAAQVPFKDRIWVFREEDTKPLWGTRLAPAEWAKLDVKTIK